MRGSRLTVTGSGADLHRLRNVYAADLMVTVMEAHEPQGLRIPQLAAAAGRLGLRWLHVPVDDGGTPPDDAAWIDAMRTIRASLADGETVIVHCKSGLGRTGMLVASVFACSGVDVVEAIEAVRAVRPGAIAGNLLGADLGLSAFPRRWVEEVELRDVVERVAQAVAQFRLEGGLDGDEYPDY